MRALMVAGLMVAFAAALVTPAAAQTVERLYVMDCGRNAATDQARWSPGVNVGKPIELFDNCYLMKHGAQWLLWDTGYPDAVADKPLTNPIGGLVADLSSRKCASGTARFRARWSRAREAATLAP